MNFANKLKVLEESLSIDSNFYFSFVKEFREKIRSLNETDKEKVMKELINEFFKKGGFKVVRAKYVEDDKGNIFLLKENGEMEFIGYREVWKRRKKFLPPKRTFTPRYKRTFKNYLGQCGLCSGHLNTTTLLNIIATNSCNLRCWYCFFYPEKSGYYFWPTLEEILKMVDSATELNGFPPPVQITGGEPTLRDDLLEIIKSLKEKGVPHIQLNTNSLKIAYDFYENPQKTIEYLREWRNTGLNTIYTSFDTLDKNSPEAFKNYWEMPLALEAYKGAGIKSVVLVPTIHKRNLKEVKNIIKFAALNKDIIRAVNFQPISFVGFASKQERSKLRVTQDDIIRELYDLGIEPDDWFPVSAGANIADLIASLTGRRDYVRLYNNEKCGMATYVYVDNKNIIPMTRFIDVDGLLEHISKLLEGLENKKFRVIYKFGRKILPKSLASKFVLKKLKSYIKRDKLPDGTSLTDLFNRILSRGDYSSLGEFHRRFLFIGMMHFMDPYNYDLNRVRRCNIHYGLPDGRVVPFCSFNVFPEIYKTPILFHYRVKNKTTIEKIKEIERREAERVVRMRKRLKEDLKNSSSLYHKLYRKYYESFI